MTDSSVRGVGLVISDYQNLTKMNFPNLTSIGSNFIIARNSNASTIDGFQSLQSVAGNLDITGDFDTLAFPNLVHVAGDFNVQSSSKNFQCPPINRVEVVHGSKFMCAGNVGNPEPLPDDNSTTHVNASIPSNSTSGTLPSSASRTASIVNISGKIPSNRP